MQLSNLNINCEQMEPNDKLMKEPYSQLSLLFCPFLKINKTDRNHRKRARTL